MPYACTPASNRTYFIGTPAATRSATCRSITAGLIWNVISRHRVALSHGCMASALRSHVAQNLGVTAATSAGARPDMRTARSA